MEPRRTVCRAGGAPRGGTVLVGIVSAPGSTWAGWVAADEGLQARVVEYPKYRSHECVGEHAWRATSKRVFVWLNGTVQAFADCEAGRFDAATRTRRVKYAAGWACPEPDFCDDQALNTNVLLEELPALGPPDAPCGGGGGAAAPPSAARAPRAAAATAAAALLAGLAAL
jgi:hypothetical protein